MPFTVSHVAVAAPLARRGLVFSALVVGSMAPDFEYFLRMTTSSHWGHTWPGVLFFSFPAALVMLWVFHRFLKRSLLHLLPQAHRRHLEPYSGPFVFFPVARFALIVVSLWIGILTHLMLDSCTHDYGLVVQWWPWLRTPVFRCSTQLVPVHDILQGVSSVGLGLVMLWQYWQHFMQGQAHGTRRVKTFLDCGDVLPVYLLLAVVATVMGAAYAALSVPSIHDYRTLRLFAGRAVVGGIDVALIEAFLVGRYLLRRRVTAPIRVRREHRS